MCLRFIFVIVCILNTSWGNVRYADINVKLEPAHIKTKGQFVSTRVNLFSTTTVCKQNALFKLVSFQTKTQTIF